MIYFIGMYIAIMDIIMDMRRETCQLYTNQRVSGFSSSNIVLV